MALPWIAKTLDILDSVTSVKAQCGVAATRRAWWQYHGLEVLLFMLADQPDAKEIAHEINSSTANGPSRD
jgi:hypothetical protein